ncbi:MAG: hypothetical protein KFW07_02705, partial [Mycoplasmataceae bacterium]|nr:hypothetical protein [Mycoplasmataceae bacterium]
INLSEKLINKPETADLKSNNPKSINSDNFDSLLLGTADLIDGVLVPSKTGDYSLKSLSFTVKEDVFWVDHNGNKTKYKINVNDFYYSFMRTKLFDTNFRRSNGGSKGLDSYFANISSTITRFGNEDKYPNEYLLGLFGMDSIALQDSEKTIQDIEFADSDGIITNKKAFTVHSIANESNPNFASFLLKTFIDSNLLAAAPSEFIDELVAKNKNKEYETTTQTDSTTTNVGTKSLEKINGIAEKFGIYLYGQQRVDNLFASAYVPIEGKDNRIIFVKNNFFADKNFIEKEDSLKKIIFEFSTSTTFKDQLFNNFFEGTISEMDYSLLTQQQKIKIFGNNGDPNFASSKGLLQVKQLSKTQLVQRTLLATDPRSLQGDQTYFFNDEYAKLVYGSTTEELKSGNATTSESFFVGDGFEFRTLLNASVNWYTFINSSTKGLKKLWLNHTAPNATYNNVVGSSSPIEQENINTIGFFDGDKKVEITEQSMKKHFDDNLSNNNLQYKSPQFERVQTLIKELLDKNKITQKNPLVWNISYPYNDAAASTIKIINLQSVVDTIKSIDNRLQPKIFVPNSAEEMIAAINDNRGVSDFSGWGYDYEGIGSFIDGISHAKGISLLGAFSHYSNVANTKIRGQSPEFAKMSDQIKIKLNPSLPVGLKVEDWHLLTNANNNDLDVFFAKYNYNIGTELSKFFLFYQDELDNDQITKLILELNIISGFSMETDISINNPNSTSLALVLPEYLYPTTHSGVLYLRDIRIGDKNV